MPKTLCPCCTSSANESLPNTDYTGCKRCGHRWRMPLGQDPREYYATLVARNDLQTPWFKRKISDRTAALTTLLTPTVRRVLEVGCAEGELGRAIKARMAITYDGIELSRDGDQAEEKLDRVFRTTAANVASEPYDLIVSFHVLEHIVDPAEEILSWSRLLTRAGQLLIEVPHQAGHPLLANDRNPEHLHQFTPASLTILLARLGFTTHSLSLGHYESPVYPDAIQLTARRRPSAEQQRKDLLKRFQARLGGPFFAYGIGGDFQNYVAPFADSLEIRALVDSSTAKRDQQIGQHRITGYDPESQGDIPILVCSIKFASAIRHDLVSMGISPERIVGLEEIYEST